MMFTYFYKLQDKQPVRCNTVAEWAQWFESANCGVRLNKINLDNEWITVSTVFLGIDYAVLYTDKKPLLFETMIFGGEWDGRTFRCSTWEEAELQHDAAIQLLFSVTIP
jgi:hypothetical protein